MWGITKIKFDISNASPTRTKVQNSVNRQMYKKIFRIKNKRVPV